MGMLDGLIEKMTGMLDDTKEAVKARDRQQWEYKMASPPNGVNIGDEWLNHLGADRWELVQIYLPGAVFKRPKLEVTDG